ncbi:predicted protein [Scheffersomyces stipitis CBS 6054]|uniref:rRNA-processing protein FYV7 n=1 Tax=Scheffersomyces stipitis (strain ATCC 58785 / CBS 6054 / NBRC 10063 / NRRL Y-11545) TaxID=322104 RepID=A3LR44_PICST|nr:predicted protein [Scheffersomyces stipitis CBS 6054]ABN65321.1 predicted protein [Scheffersomyces stipitis CBS 6054]KAG2733660.1 hypothetical protein G9P44_003185 [Scheffersomyces stipitis]
MAFDKPGRGGKSFRGKSRSSYVDMRETKSRDIKKALTHRARLRKSYFKLLEKEGMSTPRDEIDNTSIYQLESGEDEADQIQERRERKPLPKQEKVKPMNFAERAKIAKQRKEENRKAKLEDVRERRQTIERKNREREKRKERISQTTKTGQPRMGPRINNLLDKIKKDM